MNPSIYFPFLIGIFAILFFISPGIALIAIGIISRISIIGKVGRSFFAFSIIAFLAIFNGTKRISGDWNWYVEGYQGMAYESFWSYLQTGGYSIRPTEPLYYLISFIISRLSNGDIFALAVVATIAIYQTYLFALERLIVIYKLKPAVATACIIFSLIAGITFTLSLQLIRQYIAGSLLFVLFVLLLERRYKSSAIIFLLGTITHNSFVVPSAALILCFYLTNLKFVLNNFWTSLFAIGIFGTLFGSQVAATVIGSTFETSAFLNDGEISTSVLALDVAVFLIILIGIALHSKPHPSYLIASIVTAMFLAFFGGMLFGARDLSLFLLRFYFYIEWFRAIGAITLAWFFIYRIKTPYAATLLIPIAFLALAARVSQSPFDYGGSVADHLFRPALWWIENISSASQ